MKRIHYGSRVLDIYTKCHLVITAKVETTMVPVQVTCRNCQKWIIAADKKVQREIRKSRGITP